MAELPFLVRVSHIAGPVLAVLLCAMGFAFVRWVVRKDEGRRALRVRDAMGAPASALEEGDKALEGVLVGEEQRLLDGTPGVASTLRVRQRDREAADVSTHRTAGLRLRLDDGSELRLEGPVDVLAGSHRSERGRPAVPVGEELSRGVIPWASTDAPVVHDGLRAGDRVHAWGGLSPIRDEDGEGPASYRQDRRRWTLQAASEPLAGQAPNTIGLATAAAPVPPHVGRHLAVGVALGFATFAALTSIAATLAGGPSAGLATPWEQIAVLSPVYRDAVAHRIVGRLTRRPPSRAGLDALDATVSLFDVCGQGPALLARAGRLERGVAEAARCRDPIQAGQLAFSAGLLGEASAHWTEAPQVGSFPYHHGVTALLLSGDPEGAARLTDREVDLGWGVLGGRDPVADQCIRDAVRAQAHLGVVAAGFPSPTEPLSCRLLHATTLPTPRGLDAVVDELAYDAPHEHRAATALAVLWRWARGGPPTTTTEAATLSPPGTEPLPTATFVFVPHLLDAVLARAPHPEQDAPWLTTARVELRVLRSRVASALGDPERAREEAARAWAEGRDLSADEPARWRAATLFALRTLVADQPVEEAVWAAAFPQAHIARTLSEGRPPADSDLDPGVASAAMGLTEPLLMFLEREGPNRWLPYAIPDDGDGRELLRRFLLYGPTWPHLDARHRVGTYLDELAFLRDALTRLDEEASAEEVAAVGRRFAGFIERRPRAAELLAIASLDR